MLGRAFGESHHPWSAQPPNASSYSPAPRRVQQQPPFSKGINNNTNNKTNHSSNKKANPQSHTARRRRNKKVKKSASVAPIHTTNTTLNSSRGKYAARDLYVSLRCHWKVRYDEQRILHRVIVVNWDGSVVFDKPVRDLKSTKEKLASFIKGKVIIGHGLEDCWDALGLHGAADVRDCARYLPFMQQEDNAMMTNATSMIIPRTLEDLAAEYFHRNIYDLNDRLVAQARASMDLYRHARVAWENEITELLRQKMKAPGQVQHTSTLLGLHGQSEALEYIQEAVPCAPAGGVVGFDTAASLEERFQKSLKLEYAAQEEASIQASTEATLECDSVHSYTVSEDTSSIISEPSIWRPADEPSHHSNNNNTQRQSTASFGWGLWLSRQTTAGNSLPADANGWLEQQQDDRLNRRRDLESEELTEEKEFLPHHLLDESFDDSEQEIPPPEASNHPIDGSDWLESSPKREMSWFSRRRRSPEGRKDSPASTVDDIRHDCGEQSHPLEGVADSHPRNTTKSSWFPRLKRSTAVESSSASVCDPPRVDGDAYFNRSSHSCDEYWLVGEKNSQARFSFFRRKSFSVADNPSVAEETVYPCSEDVQD